MWGSGYSKAQPIATRSAGPFTKQKQDCSQNSWRGYGSQMDPMTATMDMMMSAGGIPYKGHGGGGIKGDPKLMVYVGNLKFSRANP